MTLHHIPNRRKKLPPLRVGIGGPVGSGKTTLLEMLCKAMREKYDLVAITNDIYTKEDQRILTASGALPAERIMGVETGGCPHTAIREDASINLEAIDRMLMAFPETDIVFIESGGDNLAATFSPELSDLTIYVIDVAAGEKIPRKGGPGITKSDLFVINKTDLAPHVGADLEVMRADTTRMRTTAKGLKPFVMTNLKTQSGLAEVWPSSSSAGCCRSERPQLPIVCLHLVASRHLFDICAAHTGAMLASPAGQVPRQTRRNDMKPSDTSSTTLSGTAPRTVSDQAIAQLVGQVYEAAAPTERSRLIAHLLKPLGVLSLVAVANGIFAKIRFRGGWPDLRVQAEDLRNVQSSDVIALVTRVQQVSVQVVDSLADLLTASPVMTRSAAAALLVTLLLQRAPSYRSRDPGFDA